MTLTRRTFGKSLAALTLATTLSGPALAEETIKIGVLHSLSGTMAISETILKDLIRDIPDFPKAGVVFKDITPLLAEPALWDRCMTALVRTARDAGGRTLATGCEITRHPSWW